MRLLSLDFDPVYGPEASRAAFAGDTSVFDYDVVIWDPEGSLRRYTYRYWGVNYRALPSLNEDDSVRMTADIARRRKEFLEFLNAGRAVVVVTRPPQCCYIDTGDRTHSGTGRNRSTTRLVRKVDLLSALPVSELGFHRAAGSRISLVGDGPLVGLLRKYKPLLQYQAVLDPSVGTTLAAIEGTDRVVSAMLKTKSGGHLILLPDLRLRFEVGADDEEDEHDDAKEADDEDGELGEEEDDEADYENNADQEWVDEAPEFQADLLGVLEALSSKLVMTRPSWASDYSTNEERALRTKISAQQTVVEAARGGLADLNLKREALEAREQLFLGTGRALENQVRDVMELLGGTVSEPPPGRDDWRVVFSERNAVLEVKGVAKSAAEKHAAQLEKWVASTYKETGHMPKGLLVVNTWRDTPLADRTEADFPAQMIPYSVGRKHCLVTGLQLFVIRAEIEQDHARAAEWREVLLGTDGPVAGVRDWREVIQQATTEETGS